MNKEGKKCRDSRNILYHYFQITKNNYHSQKEWPDWLIGRKEQAIFQVRNEKDIQLKTNEGFKKVNLDDYIILSDKYGIDCISPTEFNKDCTSI